MKAILSFIKVTITGGVLFLIPMVIIVVLVGKAFRMLQPMFERLIVLLDVETFMGVSLLTIVVAIFLCLLCFTAGLLIRLDKVKRLGKAVEEVILKFLPGFEYLKSMAGDQVGDSLRSKWKAVLLEDGDGWVVAFIVDQSEKGLTTVFIPECPRGDSGNSKIIQTSSLRYLEVTTMEAVNLLRHYGAGAGAILNQKELPETPATQTLNK
jgi:uncharacterized membrane protein